MKPNTNELIPTPITKKSSRKEKPIGADGHRGRMFSRLFTAVDYGLPQRDLLEMLLFYGIRVRDTRDQAVMLMNDNDNSIHAALSASPDKLTKIDGIGYKTALMLRVMGAAVDRIERSRPVSISLPSYTDPNEITKLFMHEVCLTDDTETWIAAFDSAMHVKKIQKLIRGELQPTPSDMRILLDFTARNNVDHIAIAKISHNGYNFPSINDITLARHMMQSFYRLGRNMIEYVIINDVGYSLTSPHMI